MFAFGVSALNVQMQQGASFALSAQNANAIYCADGALNVSGLGSLKTVTEQSGGGDRMPAVCAQGDIVLSGGLEAEMASVWHGICSLHGNITGFRPMPPSGRRGAACSRKSTTVIQMQIIPSSVTLKNSTVDIDTAAGEMPGGILRHRRHSGEDHRLPPRQTNRPTWRATACTVQAASPSAANIPAQSDDGMGIVAEGGILKIEGAAA